MEMSGPLAQMGVRGLDLRCTSVTCQLCHGCDWHPGVEGIGDEQVTERFGRSFATHAESSPEPAEPVGHGMPGPWPVLAIPQEWSLRV